MNSSTERLRVESSGNISIFKDLDVDGHTELDNVNIVGVTTITGDTGNARLDIHSTASGTGSQIKLHNDHGSAYFGQAGDTTGDILVYNESNTNIRFFTNGNNERLRITSGGKIGVNYAGTPPSETMMISSAESTTGLSVSHLSGGNRYGFRLSTLGGTNNGLIISRFTNSTYNEALRINSNGDVTTTGQASFDRQNAGFTARAGDAVSITRASGTPLEINRTGSDGQMISLMDDNSVKLSIGLSSGSLVIGVPNSNSERLRIGSSGGVGISTDKIRNSDFIHIATAIKIIVIQALN